MWATARMIKEKYAGVQTVGLLGTDATIKFQIYDPWLKAVGINPIVPVVDGPIQAKVMSGIRAVKASAGAFSQEARELFQEAADWLGNQGAEAFGLVCTEVPLAMKGVSYNGRPLINPVVAGAEAALNFAMGRKDLQEAIRDHAQFFPVYGKFLES